MAQRRGGLVLCLAWAVSLALLCGPVVVWAHSYVAETTPPDGGVLDSGPEEIRVVFTEPIEPGVSRLRLVDAAGEEIPGTQEAVGGRELRLVPDAPLPPGDYRVEWQTLAKDGHVTEGSFAFSVRGEASGASGAPPSPPAQGGDAAPAQGDAAGAGTPPPSESASESAGGAASNNAVPSTAAGEGQATQGPPAPAAEGSGGGTGSAEGVVGGSVPGWSLPGVVAAGVVLAVVVGWWYRRWRS